MVTGLADVASNQQQQQQQQQQKSRAAGHIAERHMQIKTWPSKGPQNDIEWQILDFWCVYVVITFGGASLLATPATHDP